MSRDYEVRYGFEAENDLINIYNHISVELLSPNAADNQLNRLFQRIGDLRFMPARFAEVESDFLSVPNLRKMPIDNFNVYYRIIEERLEVEIIRVLYYRRDFNEVMRDGMAGFVSDHMPDKVGLPGNEGYKLGMGI